MTRSFQALMHGDLAASFRYHPGGPLLALTFLFVVISVATRAARRARPFVDHPRAVRVLEASALICLILGLGRAI
jgi:hypothetical protein